MQIDGIWSNIIKVSPIIVFYLIAGAIVMPETV